MLINIAELFSQTVKDVSVDKSLSNETISFGGETYPVAEPIRIELTLTKLDQDSYLADGIVTAVLTMPCDRCMVDVMKEVKVNFSKELKLNQVDDYEEELHEYLDGVVLDLEKLTLDEVYMNLPMKVLCSDKCQGLCRMCGKNLNHATCSCESDNVDPRLAGLKDLLKEFKEV